MFGLCEKKAPKKSLGEKALGAVGRAAILPIFIVGAKTALNNADYVGGMAEESAKKLGIKDLPVDGPTMAKVNAYAQMGLGSALALGIFPKYAAWGLIGSLIPTTLVGHAFWEKEDKDEKGQEKLQFAKNTAIIGGLLNIATRK
ncbi:DoxX family protein [Corynebacterium phocae]|nr:DoxX family protein [Corynebacterium phocae]